MPSAAKAAELKSRGKCVRNCGRDADPERVTCAACRKAIGVRRARKRREDYTKCKECGSPPLPDLRHCAVHNAKRSERSRRQYARRKAAGKCPRCGKPKLDASYTYCHACAHPERSGWSAIRQGK